MHFKKTTISFFTYCFFLVCVSSYGTSNKSLINTQEKITNFIEKVESYELGRIDIYYYYFEAHRRSALSEQLLINKGYTQKVSVMRHLLSNYITLSGVDHSIMEIPTSKVLKNFKYTKSDYSIGDYRLSAIFYSEAGDELLRLSYGKDPYSVAINGITYNTDIALLQSLRPFLTAEMISGINNVSKQDEASKNGSFESEKLLNELLSNEKLLPCREEKATFHIKSLWPEQRDIISPRKSGILPIGIAKSRFW